MKKKFYISFIISIIVFSFIFINLNNSILSKNKKTDEYSEDASGEEEAEELKEIKDEMLFLMLGVDSNDLDEHSNIRTDTMILSRVNFKTGQTSLISIPRDTRVMLKGKLDKINHAHSYGGIDLTLRTVREFLDIDLDYYVKVNYQAVKEIVNAIGGVEIDIPKRMKHTDTTKNQEFYIDLQKGIQTLNGDKALEYLRFRSYPDGDIGRVKAQQIFIKEFANQAFSIKNIFKIPKIIKTYYDYVDTNIPIKTVLKATNFNKEDILENIKINTIPGEGKTINGISYYIYEEEATQDMIEEMLGDYLY